MQKLEIRRLKSWWWIFYGSVLGLVFIVAPFTPELDAHWMIEGGVFIMGLFILGCYLVPAFSKTKKFIVLEIDGGDLVVSEKPKGDDEDFNKRVKLSEVDKFYTKYTVKWRPAKMSEIVNGIFYKDKDGEEKNLLDFTFPDSKVDEADVETILDFVNRSRA